VAGVEIMAVYAASSQAIVSLAGGCIASLDGQALTNGTDSLLVNPEFMAWGDESASL